jgi:N-acetyl sugar amidotransferase
MSKQCSKCLYTTGHPFSISLTNSLCSGCITHDEKYTIDWEERKNLLNDIVKEAKKKSKIYDCVVPVTGDAEDYYVVSKVLELKLNPLIVFVNDYFKNNIGWYNIHNLITEFDVDSFLYNPNIRVYKELIRTSLRKFEHILLPFLTLHTSFPVHIAKERNIPLVIWGQHQAVEQTGKFSHYDSVQMSKWSRKEHDLFGNDINTLIGNGAQVLDKDLTYYKYPQIKSLNKVQGIYLSNYFPWDPLKQNNSIIKYGFKPQSNTSSFDIYERAGSSVYYQIHDLLKYKRVGYRKVTDHLTREMRHGRIKRDEALSIEKYYTNSPVNVEKFFKWIGMSDSGMKWYIMHQLKGYEHLLSNKTQYSPISLPKPLQNLIVDSHNSQRDYLLFEKGLEI